MSADDLPEMPRKEFNKILGWPETLSKLEEAGLPPGKVLSDLISMAVFYTSMRTSDMHTQPPGEFDERQEIKLIELLEQLGLDPMDKDQLTKAKHLMIDLQLILESTQNPHR